MERGNSVVVPSLTREPFASNSKEPTQKPVKKKRQKELSFGNEKGSERLND